MSRIRDISQTLSPTLPVWPGDTPFSATRTWVLDAQCPVNVAKFTSSTHAGTHGDAPLHYDPAGKAIDAVALDPYLGPARVVDLRGRGNAVTAAMVEPALTTGVRRILIRSFDRFPHDRWTSDYMSVAAEAIRVMAAAGVVLIGIDGPSLDPQESKTLDAHMAVRETGMSILEGLVLDDVEPGDYELIALPLKLAGLDSAPVRAVLRDLDPID